MQKIDIELRKIGHMLCLTCIMAFVAVGCGDGDGGGGTPAPPSGKSEVKGRVYCGDQPIVGAVVSDGYKVVQTDAQGRYSIQTDKAAGYVFLSTPSGYKVVNDGIIPRHFARVSGDDIDEVDFSLTSVNDSRFHLFVTSDVHLINDATDNDLVQFDQLFVPKAKSVIAALKADNANVYGFALGDMTTDSKWYKNSFGLSEYLRKMEQLQLPTYHCMGNHDNDPYLVGDWLAARTYKEKIGPNYYSFNMGQWHIIMLDNIIYKNAAGGQGSIAGTSDYSQDFSKEVEEWIAKDLSFVSKSTPVLIGMHSSYTRNFSVTTQAKFMKMVAGFETVHLMTGHNHLSDHYQLNGSVREHKLPPPAGVHWNVFGKTGIHITKDGTPGGYATYTFDGKHIEWHYYSTDYNDYQFRAYDMNSVPEAYGGTRANKILVNVFYWDQNWTVVMKENGQPLQVTQTPVTDPLYTYVASVLYPSSDSGVNAPSQSQHMFTATATNPTSTIEITVTDAFGNVYVSNLIRPQIFGYLMK